jgi:signal transduction histidine kinase
MKENLLIRFSVVSLAIMAIIAVGLSALLSQKIRSDTLNALTAEAVGAASGRVLGVIAPADLEVPMSGERYDRFHRFVAQSIVSERIARVKLLARDGTVIYSDDPAGIGRRFPNNENFLKALRGETATQIKVPNAPENVRERYLGTLMEVYTPLVFPGSAEPQGILEIYQYYAPIAERIADLRRWVFGSVAAGFILLYLGLVGVVRRGWGTINRQQAALAKANEELRTANEELCRAKDGLATTLDETARLYEQIKEMAVMEEREWIAREMHDGLAQQLGYLHLRIAQLEANPATAPTQEDVRMLKKVAAAAYDEVRQAILGLRTMVSRGLGLVPTLTEYLHDFSQQTGIAVELQIADERATRPSAHAEIQLIRIIQEALANVRKHARTKRAYVSFTMEEGNAKVTVEDDGIGFDPEQAMQPGRTGFGLQGMRERAELAGGTCTVESRPHAGTRVIVCLPVEKEDGM